jgi:hypothetical protein
MQFDSHRPLQFPAKFTLIRLPLQAEQRLGKAAGRHPRRREIHRKSRRAWPQPCSTSIGFTRNYLGNIVRAHLLIAVLLGNGIVPWTPKAAGSRQQAPRLEWQQRSSDRFELDSTAPDQDAAVLPIATRILKEDEETAGWSAPPRVRLQLFPTLDAFRDTTGEPGWVAAATQGNTIRLQPLAQLRARSILESTLRHELFHILVESQAAKGTPLWFREGLVLYFTTEESGKSPTEPMSAAKIEAILRHPRSREETDRAYVAAYAKVARLIEQDGRETVVQWLARGLPAGIDGGV